MNRVYIEHWKRKPIEESKEEDNVHYGNFYGGYESRCLGIENSEKRLLENNRVRLNARRLQTLQLLTLTDSFRTQKFMMKTTLRNWERKKKSAEVIICFETVYAIFVVSFLVLKFLIMETLTQLLSLSLLFFSCSFSHFLGNFSFVSLRLFENDTVVCYL